MRRREFITLLGGAATWPLAAQAQQPERVRRIGVLMAYAESDGEGQAWIAALGGKWLELLKETAPRTNRVAFLFNPTTAPFAAYYLDSFKAAARTLAVEAITAPVRDVSQLESTVVALAREPNGAVIVMPEAFLNVHRLQILSLAARQHLPAAYPFRFFAELGGLLSYGTEPVNNFRRAASFRSHPEGEKPADLPVQAPTKYELVINLRTAKVLGLEILPTLLARADEVIE